MPDINVNKLSEALNTKADIDLNNTGVFSTSSGVVNLTSSTPADAIGKEVTSADFIKSDIQSNLLNYTTNRILEIPQDIKWRTDLVETDKKRYRLTILQGSVYYVPQGFEADGVTRKFSKRVTINDNTCDDGFWSNNVLHEEFVFLIFKDNKVVLSSTARVGSNITSGETAPTTFLSNRALWYDTKNNYVKFTEDSGATWYNCSLPLLKGSPRNTIDETHPIAGWVNGPTQVFNGFGYIGSTIYALPGIKVQGAFGVNEDGTYRLKTFVTDHVLTTSHGSNISGRYTFGFDIVENGTYTYFGTFANEPKVSETQPSGTNFAWWNPIRGETHYVNFSGIDEGIPHCPSRLGWVNISGGKIVSMTRNPTDSIVTSNALNFSQSGRSYLSGLGMPSDRYIDLTLGASGSTYTAPANGWLFLDKAAVSGQYIEFIIRDNNNILYYEYAHANGDESIQLFIPIEKGRICEVNYTAGASFTYRFIYAQGEQ